MVGVAFIGTRTHALPDPARTRPLTHAHMNDWGRDCVTRSERMIHSTVDRNSYATPKNAMPLHRHTSGKCVLAWIRGRALIWIKQKDHEDNMTKKQSRHFPRRKKCCDYERGFMLSLSQASSSADETSISAATDSRNFCRPTDRLH